MRIELSPGDWAGVVQVVEDRITYLRDEAKGESGSFYDELVEAADDWQRVLGSLVEQIAAGGVSPLDGATYCPDCGNALDDWRGHGSECMHREDDGPFCEHGVPLDATDPCNRPHEEVR